MRELVPVREREQGTGRMGMGGAADVIYQLLVAQTSRTPRQRGTKDDKGHLNTLSVR